MAAPKSGLASGAFPTATFPCDHLSTVGGPSSAPPEQRATAQTLRQVVSKTDWSLLYAEGKTVCQMQQAWSASDERCNTLGCFCSMLQAKRVLEIGAFCGAASLSMAEVLPADGEVVSLDIDPYPFEEVGREVKASSPHFSKVHFVPGPAKESLDQLASQPQSPPFDLVVIDADKSGLRSYFDLACSTPNLVSEQATLCVDITPFKGTPPDRYVKFGQADRWEQKSGQEEIDSFRSFVQASDKFITFELAGMLVVRRTAA